MNVEATLARIETLLVEMKAQLGRHVWRLDNLEVRVEKLEVAQATQAERDAAQDKPRLADKLAEKVVWGALGALGVMGLKAVGVV